MTRSHDFAPHLRLASAQEYIELPEIEPALHAFRRFYRRYGQLATTVTRRIDDRPVEFSAVRTRMMTREPARTALVLLENQAEFDDKHYRLFAHKLGGDTVEYRIVQEETFLQGSHHHESYSLYHAEAVMPTVERGLREGLLRLGSSALSASHWTAGGTESNLEDISHLQIPYSVPRPAVIGQLALRPDLHPIMPPMSQSAV